MKVAVYIGRFQPFHYGHKAIIDELISKGYYVLVLIGVPHSKSERNPISTANIKNTISFHYKKNSPIAIRYLQDQNDNTTWLKGLDHICHAFSSTAEFSLAIHNKPSEAGKYGLKPDQFISEYILENSTMIDSSIDMSYLETPDINATTIREQVAALLKLAPHLSLASLIDSL